MIAMNTTAALLVNAEPLSRGNGKGADVVNNVKTANPIIAHKPVSTTDGENAIMLRGAAEAILDMFHALSYADDDQKEVVNGVKEAFEEAAFLLQNAANAFEEKIPFKVLDKRRKTFFALTEIDEKDSDVLAAITAINSGLSSWMKEVFA